MNNMINILSQVTNKNGVDFIYDCLINDEDLVCFTYLSKSENVSEIISNLVIDFPTLRLFMESDNVEFDFNNIVIKDSPDHYELNSKLNNNGIIIPKIFLSDAYQILKNMWIDD